jgi:hypothetical protein
MKAQTRLASLKEQAINILVGFGIQFVANYFVLPLFGMHPSIRDLFGMGAIFTVISVVRGYVSDVPPDFQHVIEEFAAERQRQIGGEGYSLTHDDEHGSGELAGAAAAYAYAASLPQPARMKFWDEGKSEECQIIEAMWPWSMHSFKPTVPRRDLVKAGALLIAEIGRRDRAKRRAA